MSLLRSSHRLLSSHRRVTALVGLVLVLGVVALNAHAALPDHHGHDGDATVCIAALSIAVLATLAWGAKRADAPAARPMRVPIVWCEHSVSADSPAPSARAGPSGRVVLRR
jgi:hypothetical protein